MLLKNLTEMFANSVKQATFSNVFYRLSRNLNEHGDTNLNWIYFFRTILNECGFTYIWETENFLKRNTLKHSGIHRLISDNYINYSTCINISPSTGFNR
jgi:tryptophan synthase beta subunit